MRGGATHPDDRHRKRRLGVAATAPFGADVLERLAARRPIEYLLTRPDRPRGRGRRIGPPPAKVVAERLGIPVRQPDRLTADLELDADTIVVAAYGLLIPTQLLERARWLNVHPSLLPRWRGAAPVERALMAGDRETGVTIHLTTPELDAGPILAQRAFPIEPGDDAGAVFSRAAALAVDLLEAALDDGEPTPQPPEGGTYAEKLTPADRELDLSQPPEELVNRIRALSPHVGARAELYGRPVTIWRARVEDGRFVPVEVQPDGRRRMSYDEFRRGLR
jgi:methionyl-tRNA formyltransferase